MQEKNISDMKVKTDKYVNGYKYFKTNLKRAVANSINGLMCIYYHSN